MKGLVLLIAGIIIIILTIKNALVETEGENIWVKMFYVLTECIENIWYVILAIILIVGGLIIIFQ